jgi:hypothetical protein
LHGKRAQPQALQHGDIGAQRQPVIFPRHMLVPSPAQPPIGQRDMRLARMAGNRASPSLDLACCSKDSRSGPCSITTQTAHQGQPCATRQNPGPHRAVKVLRSLACGQCASFGHMHGTRQFSHFFRPQAWPVKWIPLSNQSNLVDVCATPSDPDWPVWA